MKPLKIILPILLIGAGVVGIAVYRYSKPSAVPASPAPRVAVKDEGKTINLAASGKGEGGTKAASTLQAFRDRIMKAKAEKNRAKRMALLSEAVQALDPSQLRESLDEFKTNPYDQFRTRLRSMLLSRWGESDPKAALDYAKGLVFESASFGGYYGDGGFDINGLSISPWFDSWLKKDFPAAKAWLEGLPADSFFRIGLWPSLAFDLAQRDPIAALSLARTMSNAQNKDPIDRRSKIISGAIVGWSLKDTDAALAYVAQLPDDQIKTSILQSMIVALAPKDPDKAINLLDQIPPQEHFSLLKFGSAWAQSDPKAALDFANHQTDPEFKSWILRGVIEGIADKNPDRALELARSLPEDYNRELAICTVLEKLSESDPEGAVGYAMNLLSSENKNPLISSMAGDWISNDPQGAIAWFGSLTDPKLKEQVTGMMITVLSRDISQENADKAIDLLETIPPGDVQNQALSAIGKNWAQTDQKGALDWANQQTDPEVKSRILEGVIRTMSAKDPKGAFQLAQSLPAGNIRDNSIKNSLGSMAYNDPRSAIGLASGIANADDRSKAQQIVVTIWKSVDPAAATRWVNSSTLPQDVKTRLLQQK